MNDSPKTKRRRAGSEILARILAEGRALPRRRQIFAIAGAGLLLFVLLALAVESSQALRFRIVDPWPAEQPALWMPSGGHVLRLEAAVGRLQACLRENDLDDEVLAVAPDPRLGPQGLYWTLWLISMMPETEIRPLGADGDPSPARLLISGAARPQLELLCQAEPLRLYGLRDGGAS